MADLQITLLPTASVVPYAANARLHSEAQVQQIAASIKEFGFNNPILVDAKGELVAGHGRILAAKLLGIENVPSIRLGHLTPAQARAFRLADNQIALNASWDDTLLAAELRALAAEDFDLNLLGFADKDVTSWLNGAGTGGAADEDEDAPPAPATPVSQPGDVWLLGKHRIMCGSSTDPAAVAALLGKSKPMLMVTDPPYGVNYDPEWRNSAQGPSGRFLNAPTGSMGKVENDHIADWRDAWALFPGDIAYVWHANLHVATVVESIRAVGFDLRSYIIWAKPSLVIGRGHYHWQHEPCIYAVRKGATGHWQGSRKESTLWQIDSRGEENESTVHSTQKPVECMRRPIVNHTKRGAAVYEPFSGSGTTIIAAESTGRNCLAMELNPAYVDVAVLRWQRFAGGVATLQGHEGATFADVAAQRGVAIDAA